MQPHSLPFAKAVPCGKAAGPRHQGFLHNIGSGYSYHTILSIPLPRDVAVIPTSYIAVRPCFSEHQWQLVDVSVRCRGYSAIHANLMIAD